jgi:hypothetical protein
VAVDELWRRIEPGTRSHPGTAHPSAAPTSTTGPPSSRSPMLPSSRCSTPHQTQTEPTTRRRCRLVTS